MVPSRFIPLRLPARRPDRGLRVAVAIARRRLLAAHLDYILELMDRADGAVPGPSILAIYARIHSLSETDVEWLANEVLCHLAGGEERDGQDRPRARHALRERAMEWDTTESPADRIRRRLKGRRNHAFREWVARHTGHVECEIVRLHVDNLVALNDVMGPQVSRNEVIRQYMSAVSVRRELWQVLHWGLLDRLWANRSNQEVAEEGGELVRNGGAHRASSRMSHDGCLRPA
jgi:hypothetical protein